MNVLPGLLLLLAFQLLGELINIATGTVVPGPVIGLVLLLALLMVRRGVPAALDRAGSGLLGQLGLLFMPPSVGLIFIAGELDDQWPAIAGAVVVGTALTLGLSAWLMQRLIRAKEHRIRE